MTASFDGFKLGCLPQDPTKPRLKFSQFATGIIPDHPVAVNYLDRLDNWQMLGNNQYGNCVAVTASNYTRHVTAALSVEDYPSYDEVIELYKTQNPRFPRDDGGMVIQYMLEYWSKNEWSGRKLVAFAQVDHTNLEELKAAIAIFGGILPGYTVTAANNQQHSQGLPWDYVRGSRSLGGHSVMCGGYLGKPESDITFVTWSKETVFTDSCIRNQWNECWVAILPEHLGTSAFQQGVDLQALADAYKTITGGKVLPIPPQPPRPPQPPTPPGKTIEEQLKDLVVMNAAQDAKIAWLISQVNGLKEKRSLINGD